MTLVAHPIGTPAPAEPTSPIKPSEALRLGRLFRPVQVIGAMFGGTDEACALGAMIVGSGGDESESYDFLERRFPELASVHVECPAATECLGPARSGLLFQVLDVIYHLNDDHLWSDDDITGFLRGHSL